MNHYRYTHVVGITCRPKLWRWQQHQKPQWEHIGWYVGGPTEKYPRGLAIVGSLFVGKCKFKGDDLPPLVNGDTIALIFNKNKHTLQFELNGKLLNSKVTNIPAADDGSGSIRKSMRWCAISLDRFSLPKNEN